LCDFPPLRLTFSSENTEDTVFAGQGKLKLVVHCKSSEAAEANILKEYAAYKMFNQVSSASYKVRLARINYRDTDHSLKEDNFIRYGFLIESAAELANRVGGVPAHVSGVRLSTLDQQHAARVYVFQYLIGNTDWSLVTAEGDDACCHNGDLFDIQNRRYFVPYDFDLSGLVNARYAKPDASLQIRKVTQRLYRGYCIAPDALEAAIRDIAGEEKDILSVINQVPGLTGKEIEKAVNFLAKFFDQASNAEKLAESFENRCL
jgi:hypothetical protein